MEKEEREGRQQRSGEKKRKEKEKERERVVRECAWMRVLEREGVCAAAV